MKKILLLATAFLAMKGANAQIVNINGSLESWRTFTVGSGSLEAPDGWFGADSLIYAMSSLPIGIVPKKMLFKETTAANVKSGTASAKAMSRNQGQIGVVPGVLTNTKVGIQGTSVSGLTFSGGTPVSDRIKSVHAWIKYQPKGSDQARLLVQAVLAGQGSGGKDSVVASADTLLSAITAFTQIGINLQYNGNMATPDRLKIIFMSSGSTSGVDSSTLWVDEVTANVHPVGIDVPQATVAAAKLYPNPAGNKLMIETSTEAATIRIYAADGRLALSKELSGNTEIEVSQLAAGSYYYQIERNARIIQYDQLVIAR